MKENENNLISVIETITKMELTKGQLKEEIEKVEEKERELRKHIQNYSVVVPLTIEQLRTIKTYLGINHSEYFRGRDAILPEENEKIIGIIDRTLETYGLNN